MVFPYFSQMQQFATAWKAGVDEHVTRLEQLGKEWSGVEERAFEAIDESAKLFKASLRYGLELSAAWRKLGFEAARACGG